jgi:crotonobetainyl-CoA:carnitine CoA-transferase CaiB-like acyl-CoA transferase
MTDVLTGTRVLEVAMWAFVPSAGAVLADWGADVIKVERPGLGDPQRGILGSGFLPGGDAAVDYMVEIPNRGKRSVSIDLTTDDGLELLYRLAETADVFLTNWLPDARRRRRIDVEHIRARNPDIIYVRGHGQGVRGPDSERGGYDSSSYWSRGGIAYAVSPPDQPHPVRMRSAFGDIMGGLTLAGAIGAALYRREKTGEASVVDVSLLNVALWQLSVDVVSSKVIDSDEVFRYDPDALVQPTVGMYRTQDGRHLNLTMLESDRYWTDLCEHLGHPELIDDERFKSRDLRSQNRRECTQTLQRVFASRTRAEWRELLATTEGVWAPLAQPRETHDDPQVVANGYIPTVTTASGAEISLVASPVQFDEEAPELGRAPLMGEHTDELLHELGLTPEEIQSHRASGTIS